MIPWIQVYSNLPSHPKTMKLAEELGITGSFVSPAVVATGILVSLWTWAIQNAYDGDLSGCSALTISEACRWKKSPQKLLDALKKAGFIDGDGYIHDWEEYAVLLMNAEDERKKKTRERVKKCREKSENVTVTSNECNGNVTLQKRYSNVTVRECNAPTIPYHTVPDQTKEVSLDNIIKKEKEKEKEKQEKETEKGEKSVSVENPVENSFERKKAATIAALKNIDEKGRVPYAREVMCNASP